MSPAIETLELTRRYGRRLAVDALSMTVPQNAVYGFLGRNGAGKTTTLKMLLGLIRPSSGAARVCGVDVARDRLDAARRVGALLEAHGFYGNLSGRENLDLTRRLLELPDREIGRVLEVVEMADHAGRRVSDYSLGMRQRLGLARAMLGAPPVLILDEPTNGLDPDGIADMRRFLGELPARTGATVLLSSHLLGEIEQTATHVGIVHEGRLVLEGELARLKAGMAPEIAVETDDPARAAALAASRGFSVAEAPGRIIAALTPGDDARMASAALNRALVEADIAVFSIGPKARTLEGIYRQVSTPPVVQPLMQPELV
ncbi:ABC transporter ATP-binding protein [Brevundimonas denitrificans]|uniref:ABC transporter ATP-binding protein n=1 Tax=Brevundimonas denitrificans TaxID=1443434 RepID=A0ABQ6BHD8_9CAUL|nr:ABC transporter ATP-binding protein [Brevundimonas denitrificans]GLS01423.1 ABC transporter ATP-binding protein [Brevundimonas denitrificans]